MVVDARGFRVIETCSRQPQHGYKRVADARDRGENFCFLLSDASRISWWAALEFEFEFGVYIYNI